MGRPRRITAVIASVLISAACGNGDDQGSGAAGSTSTSTPATTGTTTPAPTSTTATTGERELSEDSRLRLDGIGPVKIGMTVAEATQAVGREVAVDPDSLFDAESTCGFAGVSGGPEDLLFMVLRDDPKAEWKIYRVDVYQASGIATGGGIRIGATEDEVKQVYGDELKVEPHEYTGPVGHYLVLDVDGEGTGFMLLFETDGTKVTQFRSGNDEAVRAPEGCA